MSTDEGRRFARLDDLFQAALDKPLSERDSWLAEQTDAPELLAEVRALLQEDQSGDVSELEGIVDANARHSLPSTAIPTEETTAKLPPPSQSGDSLGAGSQGEDPESIGPYRIVRRLGRGGQATVYLAERIGEFSMPVALKRIRRGMDTDDILERLRLERQILARLVHPNIGRIYDGGSDEQGRPYLVMEVIEGRRIDEWCGARRLSVRDRLRLFLQACEAVDFAHQNLILHRDLKPSNILVTDDGTVKLLDFGIAKVLAGDPTTGDGNPGAAAQLTVTEMRLLTPDYASPEQLFGAPLTTASDVYSLGIVLFYLLSGRLPHSDGGRESTPNQGTFARLAGEPRDPPSVLRAARQERSAGNRLTVPEDRWLTSAGSELAAVVAKALEEDPARRYCGVRDLADDLQRLLDDRPVLARKPSLGYRLVKLARRHRVGASLTTLAVLSLLAAVAGTSWQAAAARSERARAEDERAQAEGVLSLFFEMFEVTDPFSEAHVVDDLAGSVRPRGETVTARELLDSAAQRIGAGLEGDWPRRLRLRRAIARAYFNLSLFERARGQLESAEKELEEVQRATDSGPEREVARALVARDLGRLDSHQGRFDRAEELMLTAKKGLTESGSLPDEVAVTLEYLGELKILQRDPDAAETHYQAALAMHRELSGERSPAVARSQVGLSKVRALQRRPDEMKALLEEVLTVRTERFGDQHPLVLETLNDLAVASREALDFTAAERIFVDLLGRQRQVLGHEHADLAPTLYNLATALERLRRNSEAEDRLAEAWRLVERSAGETALAAKILLLQGLLRDRADDLEGAAGFYQRGLELRRRLFGNEHPSTLAALLSLGRAWAKSGDRRAEPLLREALAAPSRLRSGEEAFAYLALGELFLSTDRPRAAVDELRRGSSAPGGEAGWLGGLLQMRQAEGLERLGRSAEALASALRARELLATSLGPDNAWTGEAEGWVTRLQRSGAGNEASDQGGGHSG